MNELASPVLNQWSNFYVIIGSSAAALTGLVFIVITLVAGERSRTTSEGIATFSSPTVVHFCTALLVAAILSAPWHSLVPAGVMLGLTGLYGAVYALLVMHRTRRQSEYRPQLDDWIWYTILPFVGYVVIVAAAIRLSAVPTEALFALAGAALLLIFIGIHNAWDVVTWIAVRHLPEPGDEVVPDGAIGVQHRSEATAAATVVTRSSSENDAPPSVM